MEDYDFVSWLYNNGSLRSDEEIAGAVIGATVAGCASYYFSGKADRKRAEGGSSQKI